MISPRISTRSLASRLESGSSIRNAAGSRTIARPIATRWRWPPDSCRGLRSSSSTRPEHGRRLIDAAADLLLRDARHLQAERHVAAHRHMCVERVVLEHHRDVAVARRQLGHQPVVDPDLAAGDRLQPGHHPQRGGLAASGRAHQHEELARLHLQAEVVHRHHAAGEVLGHRLQRDGAASRGSCQHAGDALVQERGRAGPAVSAPAPRPLPGSGSWSCTCRRTP